MSTLVVYYSLEGNTRFIAQAIATAVNADILELKTIKPFPTEGFKKFFIGGMYSTFRMHPALQAYGVKPTTYDNIIIGTPVWAGTFAAPINTFIKKIRLAGKNIALFACHAGPEPGKCFISFKKALDGNNFVGHIDFVSPLKCDKAKITEDAKKWAEGLPLD